MKKFMSTIIVVLAVLIFGSLVHADAQSDGYFSTNLGFHSTSSFDYLGSSTDQGSVCDPIINPSSDSRQAAGCPTEGTGWLTQFDNGSGIATHFLLGRHVARSGMWGNLSVELEFSYRESELDQTSSIRSRSGVARDKLSNEIYRAEEHIGKITSHTAFVNVRYSFRQDRKIQPFIGAGVGFERLSVYGGRIWVRNNDWTQISTGSTLPNSEEVRRNLAGTTSAVHETLTHSASTLQVFAGINLQINDATLIGVRGQFSPTESFEATGSLDVLRSHEVPAGYASRREIDSFHTFGIGLHITFLM